jgi:secreted trypsin-like serine protease
MTCSSVINDQRVQLCASGSNGTKGKFLSIFRRVSLSFCFGDTCQGDSGGPLMMFSSNNRWILMGITSYGYGCAQPDSSGIYTRVAAFQGWIHSIISSAYLQTPSISYISVLVFLSYLKTDIL